MEPEFWLERWQDNRIGFHQAQTNRFLQRYQDRLGGTGPIFVPLCGKSRDMVWLQERGREVVGIELSALAVESFFAEAGLAVTGLACEPFYEYRASGFRLLVGDFFALTRAVLGSVGAVYDRAALIAMPPSFRARYAAHMASLLDPGTPLLLVAPFSLKDRNTGPPFAVSAEEIEDIYGAHFAIERLECERETVDQSPQLADQGLLWREEAVYLLLRR